MLCWSNKKYISPNGHYSLQWPAVHPSSGQPSIRWSIHPFIQTKFKLTQTVIYALMLAFTSQPLKYNYPMYSLHSPQTDACKADLTNHYGLSPNTPPNLHFKRKGGIILKHFSIFTIGLVHLCFEVKLYIKITKFGPPAQC